jgi:NAD(P)-dependent dehydrogenase (short-subunit alcohol dehydrogenase family)
MTEPETQVAVITGAHQGIGRRIAEVLASEGYSLALIDQVSPDETLAAVKASGADSIGIACDVSRQEDVDAAVATTLRRFGRADVLVNNAGIGLIAAAESTTAEQWRRVLDVNLTGPFLLCKAFSETLLRQRRGRIVNIASICGICGVPDRVAYNASKHGLIGLTRTLAVEWGGRGIRVNAVCPSWVQSEEDEAELAALEAQGPVPFTREDITDRVALARFARPEDIAQAVVFLADDAKSGFINGVALSVDGGWHIDASWRALRLAKR